MARIAARGEPGCLELLVMDAFDEGVDHRFVASAASFRKVLIVKAALFLR
jgi:hypothetical protein